MSYAPNELQERPRPAFWALLLEQVTSFLVIFLIVAAVLSLVLGELIDAAAILVIVLLNAILGAIQQARAEQAFAALKRMAAPMITVMHPRWSARAASRCAN